MRLMKTPRSLDLLLTSRCNLRCMYCSHFSSGGEVDHDLPTDQWLGFFEELTRCAVMDVCLQGGEPFIRSDLRELVQGIVRNRMRFSILSNGTLITDEMAEFLASTGRCNSVQVSIDGSTPFAHDAFRGEGNFRRAVDGLKRLIKHGISATVRVTIHRKNVRELEAIARLLLEDIGLPSFSTNAASHLGLCRKNAEQVQLTAEERSLAMETLGRLARTYSGRISATAGPLAEARHWSQIEEARRCGLESLPGGGYLTGCGGPTNKLAIRADGVMLPCSQIPDLELGRINKDDLRQVWTEHPILNRFRERVSIPLKEFAFCRGCPYVNYCTGNCPALSYTLVQDAWHPSPDACYRRFLEAGGRLPRSDGNPASWASEEATQQAEC
ncbi:MAG: SynChlorMet cassette radical SAM/SPASM protein ScmE [Desulfomonile tiedjei]|nr:SynChlorMet cassette radical SAM/SPASM protein ScmE [Desulfomonile tiedjei]